MPDAQRLYGQTFDRWEYPQGTFTFSRLRKYHTELNHYYWSFMGSLPLVYTQTRKQEPTANFPDTFSLNIDRYGRKIGSIESWDGNFRDFQNWVRLGILLSLSSNFEIYMKSIAGLSLQSRPGLLLDSKDAIDGVRLLKTREEYSFQEEIKEIVIGDWSSRTSTFERFFGFVPTSLTSNLSDLEAMRKLRNSFSHTYGRDMSITDLLIDTRFKRSARLSEERLLKWMGIIYEITKELDKEMGERFIGNYEVVSLFHRVFTSASEQARAQHANNLIRPFRQKLGEFNQEWNHVVSLPSMDFVRGLISYYVSV